MLGHDPGSDWWSTRAARRVLFADPTRNWHQIMSEAALRWTLGTPDLMVQQVEHLIEVSRRDNVRLGVIALATPKPIAAPAPFHLIDDDTGMIATEVGTSFITDPHDLDHFGELFTTLDQLAVYDEDARELLYRVRHDHQAPR